MWRVQKKEVPKKSHMAGDAAQWMRGLAQHAQCLGFKFKEKKGRQKREKGKREGGREEGKEREKGREGKEKERKIDWLNVNGNTEAWRKEAIYPRSQWSVAKPRLSPSITNSKSVCKPILSCLLCPNQNQETSHPLCQAFPPSLLFLSINCSQPSFKSILARYWQ